MFNQKNQKVYASVTNIVGGITVAGDVVDSTILTGSNYKKFNWEKGDVPNSRRLFYHIYQANIMKDERKKVDTFKFNVTQGSHTVLEGTINAMSSAVVIIETFIEMWEM